MSDRARGLDHVVHAVRDLAAARSAYRALGFTTTPPALHPWGTGNSLVQLDRAFVEILSVEAPEKILPPAAGMFSFGQFNVDFLAAREGMSMLVFSSDDALADGRRWRDAGLATYAPFEFSRTATLPGGEQVTVAFSLSFVTDPGMPGVAWFVCQQHFPEHFWKAEYQRHGNGASRMRCVWMQAEEPASHAAFLAALFPGESSLSEVDGGLDLELGYGRVALRTPAALGARFPGQPLPPRAAGPVFAAVSVEATAAPRQACVHGLVVDLC